MPTENDSIILENCATTPENDALALGYDAITLRNDAITKTLKKQCPYARKRGHNSPK